ncbi:UNVERIFIED_CONTAM: hypothetical protein HDU68_012728 [Siphonaria sp. JEL0065]|nr:hypothetical protein HDU68_012728 [Siphonaria sp. JEL0065]
MDTAQKKTIPARLSEISSLTTSSCSSDSDSFKSIVLIPTLALPRIVASSSSSPTTAVDTSLSLPYSKSPPKVEGFWEDVFHIYNADRPIRERRESTESSDSWTSSSLGVSMSGPFSPVRGFVVKEQVENEDGEDTASDCSSGMSTLIEGCSSKDNATVSKLCAYDFNVIPRRVVREICAISHQKLNEHRPLVQQLQIGNILAKAPNEFGMIINEDVAPSSYAHVDVSKAASAPLQHSNLAQSGNPIHKLLSFSSKQRRFSLKLNQVVAVVQEKSITTPESNIAAVVAPSFVSTSDNLAKSQPVSASSHLSTIDSDIESMHSESDETGSQCSFGSTSDDELTLDDSGLLSPAEDVLLPKLGDEEIPSYEASLKRHSADASSQNSTLEMPIEIELPYSFKDLYLISHHKLTAEKKPLHLQVLINNFISVQLAPRLPEETL